MQKIYINHIFSLLLYYNYCHTNETILLSKITSEHILKIEAFLVCFVLYSKHFKNICWKKKNIYIGLSL